MFQRLVFASLVLLTCAGGAPPRDPLDLIPGDAMAGLAIRSVDDLKKKGDKFIQDTGIPLPLRPSQLFDMIFQQLGIKGGIDEKGPAAVVLVNEKAVGLPLVGGKLEHYLVLVLPCGELGTVEAGLGLGKGELKPDKVIPWKTPGWKNAVCYVHDKQLFLGGLDKAVLSVVKGKKLGAELSAAQRKLLGKSDVVLHLGTSAWGQYWKDTLKDAERHFDLKGGEAERQAAALFVKALAELRFAVGGIRLNGGLGIALATVFPQDGAASKKFLTALRGGEGASTLAGLPASNAVAAWAARGDGSKNAGIARVFFKLLVKNVLEPSKFSSVADRSTFLGLFGDVWQRLRGSRFALYTTSNERQQGLFGVVGILDTEDPQKFLDELKQLAKLGSGDGLDLSSEAGKEANRAEIERLVANLRARRFAVRESATTKLLLIGEPALPFVEKALKDRDLEVSRRAERVKREIVQAAQDRRKALLGKDLTRMVKPSFAFLPKSEELDGARVNVVGVRLSKRDAAYAPQLRQLLGPQWNRVRLAVHGKQVVVLLGSDVGLLAETLKNLKAGKAGLAEAPALKEFARHSDPGRKIELHVSVQTAVALWTAADLEKPGTIKPGDKLTSFALTVEPDRMQLDMWIPTSEFKIFSQAASR